CSAFRLIELTQELSPPRKHGRRAFTAALPFLPARDIELQPRGLHVRWQPIERIAFARRRGASGLWKGTRPSDLFFGEIPQQTVDAIRHHADTVAAVA